MYDAGGPESVLCGYLERRDGEEGRRGLQEGGDIGIPMADVR